MEQFLQPMDWLVFVNVPGPQLEQADAPAVALYLPGRHSGQVDVPMVDAKNPMGHKTHVDWPEVPAYSPRAQGSQWVCPLAVEK